ncbi:MAG: murJ [Conexibacter sp.]|nr:murJ [Conexibacter sp.]
MLELRDTLEAVFCMVIAAVWFGIAAWVGWVALDWVFGRGLIGQVISVGGGLSAGVVTYASIVLAMKLPEAEQLRRLIAGRLGRAAPAS